MTTITTDRRTDINAPNTLTPGPAPNPGRNGSMSAVSSHSCGSGITLTCVASFEEADADYSGSHTVQASSVP